MLPHLPAPWFRRLLLLPAHLLLQGNQVTVVADGVGGSGTEQKDGRPVCLSPASSDGTFPCHDFHAVLPPLTTHTSFIVPSSACTFIGFLLHPVVKKVTEKKDQQLSDF